MAKSKLYAKVDQTVKVYCQLYDMLLASCRAGAIPEDALPAIERQAGIVKSAFAEAHTHFENLEKRMGNEKTMADRLRNLKNVFKTSKELNDRRVEVKKKLDAQEDLFLTVERCIHMAVSYKKNG